MRHALISAEGRNGRRQRLLRGAVSGVLGAAALWASDWIERRALGSQPSYAPARIGRRLLRSHPLAIRGDPARQGAVLGSALRWTYGASLGGAYGFFRPALPRSDAAAALVASASIAGFELVAFPRLGATPPVHRWPRPQRLALLAHTTVYALCLALAYSRLTPRPPQTTDQPPP